MSASEPIAIVGIGCRFPGASDAGAFWQALMRGHDAIGPFPAERLRLDPMWDDIRAALGDVVPVGGFLEDVHGFDWRAFGMPPREARSADPQQRLLLEVAWEALEDAGLPLERAAGSRAGVYVAAMWNDFFRLHARNPDHLDLFSVTGNQFALLANRISFTFDLKGPSFALDLGCAGSGQTLHLACDAIRRGEIEWALAGGVNLVLSPDNLVATRRAGLLSKTGRCWTFDARADGFVPGEGAALLVLKSLSRAVADGDRIHACILGSSSNHNGHTSWIMSVDQGSQTDLFSRTLAAAHVRPEEVDYVEMHGTGTPTGDPVEVSAIADLVGAARPKNRPCALGSVKTNLGHLESAGSVAHVIKAALALRHGVIPPSIHVETLNAAIVPEAMNIHIPIAPAPIDPKGRGIAVVTSLSLGGGNVQIVLERPPAVPPPTAPPGPLLLALSARSSVALANLQARWVTFLRTLPQERLYATCRAAALRRSHHRWRVAVVGWTANALADELAGAIGRSAPAEGALPSEPLRRAARVYADGGTVLWEDWFPAWAPHVDLPVYAWHRQPFPPEFQRDDSHHRLLGRQLDLSDGGVVFSRTLDLVDRTAAPIVRPMDFVELARQAIARIDGQVSQVADIELGALLSVDVGRNVQLRLSPPGREGRSFHVASRAAGAGSPWTEHVRGRFVPAPFPDLLAPRSSA